MVANGVADSFINTALQRRYEASAYARNFPERQIAKTRGNLERSERELTALRAGAGEIITHRRWTGRQADSRDANSPGRIAHHAQ